MTYQYINKYQLSGIVASNTTPNATGSITWNYTTNNVQSATDPLSRTTSFGLPAASTTQSIVTAAGERITVVYDGSTRVTSYSNGIGTWSYSYSANGSSQTTTVTDPNGHKKTYVSNTALDVITAYTDALGRTTSYAYDGSGRLTSMTRPYGDVVAYTYDENETSARGNVTTTTWTPQGGGTAIVTHASYDGSCTYISKCNKPNSTTDGRGNVTSYTYDNTTGVLLTVTKPTGVNGVQPQTRYSYGWQTASGQSQAIYLLTGISYCNTKAASSCVGTSDEARTTIAYDAGHNLAPSTVTTAAGDGSISSTQTFTYDSYGNLATSTNPLGGVTTYFYDADRELTGVVAPDPDGSGPRTPAAARISYTADGLVGEKEVGTVPGASSFSSFSSVLQTINSYDAADRLVQVANNGGGTANNLTQYAYDNANNLQCTAVRMNTTVFGSEPGACSLGTAGLDGPDRITYRTYDAADEPYQVIDGYGSSTQRTASMLNYTSAGKVNIATDAKGNNSCFGYDGFGRLNAESFPTPSSGSNCNSSDLETYGYDANSNMTARKYRDGTTQNYSYDNDNNMYSDGTSSYGYDNLGRLTNANSSAYGWALTFDALGRSTFENNSYGGNITSGYDAAGNRIRLTYQDGTYIAYVRDQTGAVTTIEENGATSGVGVLASYGFDGLGRVTNVAYGGVGSDGFSYDTAGRIGAYSHTLNSDSGHNLVANLNYNAANGLRTRSFSNNYYDWTGSYNFSNNYTVNGLNQVTNTGSSGLSYGARGSLSNDSSNTYGYSIYNQLTSVSGSANATLAYNPLQRLVKTSGSATTTMIYDGSMMAMEFNSSGAILRRYVPGPDGRPLVWYEGSGLSDRRWLLSDQIGSVQAVMNSSGQSDGINTYDAYGLAGSSNIGRFQFAGRPFIPETGLYDNSARTYSPTLGRFLQTDPIGYADGMNDYAYTHDDPVNGTDPTGTQDYDGTCTGTAFCDPSFGAGGFGGVSLGGTFSHEGVTYVADGTFNYYNGGGPIPAGTYDLTVFYPALSAAGLSNISFSGGFSPQGKPPASNNCTMARAQLGADADRLATAAKALEVGGVAAIAGGTFGIETGVGALAIDGGIVALQAAGVANSAAAGLRSYANTGSVAGGVLVGAGSLAANQALGAIAGLTPGITNLQAQVLSSLLGQNLANFQAQVQRSLRTANSGC